MLAKRLVHKKTISRGVHITVDDQLHRVEAQGKPLFGYIIATAYINARAEVVAETITCQLTLEIYDSIPSDSYRLTFT
jgi:hypothetical protein